jgi:hypothetical protein
MRTFELKAQESKQTTSRGPTTTARVHVRQSPDVNSILPMQRTIGNQAVQRLLEANSKVLKGDDPRRIETVGLGHNFRQLSAYYSDDSELMARKIGAHVPPTVERGIDLDSTEHVALGGSGNRLSAREPVQPLHQRQTFTLQSRGTGGNPSAPSPSSARETDPARAEQQASTEGTAPVTTRVTSAATTLRWKYVKQHRWDALWYFCGEHPSGFSTSATLRAEGYGDPDRLEWFIRHGSDKVYAPNGFRGPEITLYSSAGSQQPDDVHIELQERLPGGATTSYLGHFTVRKPHRLIQESTTDHTSCPPWDPSPASCPAFWTEISYRILDNMGGTIVGGTVNERFPGPAVDDQPNHWRLATTTSGASWPKTNGTFVDNLYKCCGIPAPVSSASANWSDKVYHEPQEFYVGSTTAGRGCRVQVHTLQFYRGFAEHENIRSPAP